MTKKQKKILFITIVAAVLAFIYIIMQNPLNLGNKGTSYTEDDRERMVIDVESLDTKPAVLESTNKISIARPDSNPGFVGVFEEYEFYDKETGEFIDISYPNTVKFLVKNPTVDSFAGEKYPENPRELSTLDINVWPPMTPGIHEYIIETQSGDTYYATYERQVEIVEATKVPSEGRIAFKIGDLNLESFIAMFQAKPGGGVERFYPEGETYAVFSSNEPAEGVHTFFVKQDDVWYKAEIKIPDDLN